MAAADAGDILFAGAALHTQENLAVGALEVLIVLTVLHALGELGRLQLPVGGVVDVFTVFRNALLVIAREHTEDRCDIKGKADEGQQAAADKAAQDGKDKTGDEGKHTEIVGTMAADHKTGKGLTETLEKIHR